METSNDRDGERGLQLAQDQGGYAIAIPESADDVIDARGQAIAVHPSDLADLEECR